MERNKLGLTSRSLCDFVLVNSILRVIWLRVLKRDILIIAIDHTYTSYWIFSYGKQFFVLHDTVRAIRFFLPAQ